MAKIMYLLLFLILYCRAFNIKSQHKCIDIFYNESFKLDLDINSLIMFVAQSNSTFDCKFYVEDKLVKQSINSTKCQLGLIDIPDADNFYKGKCQVIFFSDLMISLDTYSVCYDFKFDDFDHILYLFCWSLMQLFVLIAMTKLHR